jgi:hypothetical protein
MRIFAPALTDPGYADVVFLRFTANTNATAPRTVRSKIIDDGSGAESLIRNLQPATLPFLPGWLLRARRFVEEADQIADVAGLQDWPLSS